MTTSKKKDYGDIAKKASKLLKDGIGISQILNISSSEFKKLNNLNNMRYEER